MNLRQIIDNNSNLIFNLAERWRDEKDYEDINDYLKVLQGSINGIYSIQKRPFGFHIMVDEVAHEVSVVRKGNKMIIRYRELTVQPKKKPKKSGPITLKDICSELGIEPTKARRILRNNKIEKPSEGWVWDKVPAEVKRLLG